VPYEPQYEAALAELLDPQVFWTQHPVPSVAHQTGGGIVLLALNALVAEAMAGAIRSGTQSAITRRKFMEFMWLYARLFCEEDDCGRPQTREVYSAETGEGYGALDVFSDNFNDLIIRLLAGLTPGAEGSLVIDPLATGWTHFRLDNAPYRGHLVTIIWDSRREGERYPDAPMGLTVLVDGTPAAQTPDLERIVVPLQ
jgi:hypothetical protein